MITENPFLIKTLINRYRKEKNPYFEFPEIEVDNEDEDEDSVYVLRYDYDFEFQISWKVVANFDWANQKVDSSYHDGLILLEINSLMPMIAQGVESYLLDNSVLIDRDLNRFIDYIRNSNENEYVDEAILVFPDRLNQFYKSNIINELMSSAIGEIKEIEELLGFTSVQLFMPILSELEQFSVVSMFTSLLFSMILALFIAISIILVHSLIMTSIQQQFFDIGIKRMIGENEAGVALSIILQTFAFSLPGIILAFICSFPALFLINKFAFEELLGITISIIPSFDAIISSIIIGIIIPLISSLKPIHEAIKQNINDTLDYDRSKAKADVVKVVNPSEQDVGARLIFGLISTAYAISVYILLPKSLLELNLGIIMQIFLLILIGMLFGLVLIAINIQYIIVG